MIDSHQHALITHSIKNLFKVWMNEKYKIKEVKNYLCFCAAMHHSNLPDDFVEFFNWTEGKIFANEEKYPH